MWVQFLYPRVTQQSTFRTIQTEPALQSTVRLQQRSENHKYTMYEMTEGLPATKPKLHADVTDSDSWTRGILIRYPELAQIELKSTGAGLYKIRERMHCVSGQELKKLMEVDSFRLDNK